MGLEADIYGEVWDAIRAHRNTTLSYVRGWYRMNVGNIPAGNLPAVLLYPTEVRLDQRRAGGDRFVLALTLKGVVQHFDPAEIVQGGSGRKGILDLYYDLDRIVFTMIKTESVTVDDVTTATRVFPLFDDVPQVRDIRVGGATFAVEEYEGEYPCVSVSIPIDIWYIKADSERRIS